MNREKLGAFNIHYQNAGVERIDTIMVLLVLLSRRKEKGGKWQGTYADFNRASPRRFRAPIITLTKERPVTRDLHPGQSQDNSHE